jgi:hypothetical protein
MEYWLSICKLGTECSPLTIYVEINYLDKRRRSERETQGPTLKEKSTTNKIVLETFSTTDFPFVVHL